MIQFADIQTFEEFSQPLRRSKIQTPTQQLETYRWYVENMRKLINDTLDRHLEYACQQTDKAVVLERATVHLTVTELTAAFEQAKFPPTTDAGKRFKDCVSGDSTLTDLECEELDYQVKIKLGEW